MEVRGCPTCRRLTFPIKKSALFGFSSTTELVLVAACIARLERYVDPGFDSDPISMEQLARHIERWALDPDVMHCVGVLSPTGWIGDTPQELSTGTREVVLVEPACSAGLTDQQGFAFRTHRHPTLDPRVSAIFDPESAEAKVARAIGFLEQHPTLQAPGGLLMLDEELEKLHIERSQLAEAVAQMVDEEEDKLISEHLAGEWILRRRRN